MRSTTVLLGGVALCLASCSSNAPHEEPAKVHLAQLVVQYNQYVANHESKAPISEKALKQFMATTKVTDYEGLFVSPRDKQPYVVKYAISLRAPVAAKGLGRGEDMPKIVVAYEKEGAGGKRWVAYSDGTTEEVGAEKVLK